VSFHRRRAGSIDETEWLDNLAKCAGLVAALAQNIDEEGEYIRFMRCNN
jgi:hypothetical protein